MKKTYHFFKKFSPPGHIEEYRTLPRETGIICLIGIIYSLFFWRSYHREIEQTQYWDGAEKIISSFTAIMREGHFTIVFVLGICSMFFMGFVTLSNFYKDGSYIVMKRTADPYELVKRSFTIPAICAAVLAACGWIVTMVYYLLYLYLTPEEMLPQVTWGGGESEVWDTLLIIALAAIVMIIGIIFQPWNKGKNSNQ